MTSSQQLVIIAIHDAGIRSALAAWLGASGETLVVADGVASIRVPDDARANAILIVDASDHEGDVVAMLRGEGWGDGLIILSANPVKQAGERIAYLPHDAPSVSVAAILQMWRQRRA
ncbi:hypothetical protein [Sphingomonas sp. C3-2]|uniref:hypothetical protein n=1 Tax=Sphingomonas sp. C3-2 TaxID=3062169 RepID=UPI00294B56F1|nr:hypothetical protein [Sphingomonas sp. C3-2]WOK37742.1 hypothetical protein QYC26_06000 [Sphingomonas sp. C3-2]